METIFVLSYMILPGRQSVNNKGNPLCPYSVPLNAENKTLPIGYFFYAFISSSEFFQNQLFRKILSGISSEYQMVSIQIRPGPDLGPNSLQVFSADSNNSQRVKCL